MLNAIRKLLSSAKVLTFIAGIIVTMAAKWGFSLDAQTVMVMLGVLATLIGAQGATDFGKGAAKVEAIANAEATTGVSTEKTAEAVEKV